MNNRVKNAIAASSDDERLQYLTFMLQRETFAIAIPHIKEIIEYGRLTTVPMMPDFIRGVINLRGAVVPVVDLVVRFGGKRTDITKRTCIVIIELAMDERERRIVGVIVDAVNEVLEIPASEIELPPAFGANIRSDLIQGMGKINSRFVIILDVAKVLFTEELAVLGRGEHFADTEAA